MDKNRAKCNMMFGNITKKKWTKIEKCNVGFDSDTFTKNAQNDKLKLDKNKVKSKMGFRAYNSKRGGQKWSKMQYGVRACN